METQKPAQPITVNKKQAAKSLPTRTLRRYILDTRSQTLPRHISTCQNSPKPNNKETNYPKMQTTIHNNNNNNNNALRNLLCVILVVAVVLWGYNFGHDVLRYLDFFPLTLGMVIATASYLLGRANAVAGSTVTASPVTTGGIVGNLLLLTALVLVVLNYIAFAALHFSIARYGRSDSIVAGVFRLLLALVWMVMTWYAYRLMFQKKQSTTTTTTSNNENNNALRDYLCVILTVAVVFWGWNFEHDIVRELDFFPLTLGSVITTASYLLGRANTNAVTGSTVATASPIITGGGSSVGNLLFLIALVSVVLNHFAFASLAFSIERYDNMGAGVFGMLLALVWMVMTWYAYRLLYKTQSTATTTTTSNGNDYKSDTGAAAAVVATPIEAPPADEEVGEGAPPTTSK
jgi:hypothetical protein